MNSVNSMNSKLRSSLSIFGKKQKRLQDQIAELERQQQLQAVLQQSQLEEERKRHLEELRRRDVQVRLEQEEKQRVSERLRWEQQVREENARRIQAEQARQEQERLEKERREREIQALKIERHRKKMMRLRMTSPESIRRLRDLIRRKYELDIAIWAGRKVRKPNRPYVEDMMIQADAILSEIVTIVEMWGNNSDGTWKDHEWELVQEVQARIQADGKRWWENNPPWEED